jgi:hypothetical protein
MPFNKYVCIQKVECLDSSVLFGAGNHLQHSLLDWKAVGKNSLLKTNVKVSILQLNVILLEIISAYSRL